MSECDDTVRRWLDGARLEVAPTRGAVVSVAAHTSPGRKLAVTSTPGRGLDATLRVVGVAGPIHLGRLQRIAQRIGVGESIHTLVDSRAVGSQRYQPEAWLRDLARRLGDACLAVPGLQLSTFNDVATSERWRRRLIGTADGTTAP